MSQTHRPFEGSEHHLDWENANCCRCTKYCPNASRCDIMQAVAMASIGDGSVPETIARRMGLIGNGGRYIWACPEREEEVRPL